MDLKDIRIQVYGDAAVETGIGVGHYDQAKPPWIAARGHITERFTRTWIKRHGTWQCVAYQTMVIAAGEHEPDAQHPAAAPASRPDRDSVPKGGELNPTAPIPALRR